MNAFELIPVINNVPVKIESIDIWGNNIYIGTNDGQILLYIIEKVEVNKKVTFKSRMEKKRSLGHGKKPVEKILLISDIGKLLTLCDGNLDVFNLYNLEPTTPIGPTSKGVTGFCLKKKSLDYRLCVMLKKRLCFFEYVRVFEQYKEIVLPDAPFTMEWTKNTMLLGYKKEYTVLDIDSEQQRVLFPLDKSLPRIKHISDLDKFLVTAEDIAVFINIAGEPVQGTVHWGGPPLSIAYLPPYLLSVVPSKGIEVHDLSSHLMRLVQTVQGTIGSTVLSEGRGEGKDFIIMATPSSVYCLHIGNVDSLVQDLISRGEHEDAIRLFEVAFKREVANYDDNYDPAKERLIHQHRLGKIYEQVGMNELFQMKFDSAFNYFEKSSIDPRYLVSLFPKLLPYQTSFRQQSSTSSPTTSSPQQQQQENLQELIDANVDVEDRLERMREAKLCLLAYLEKRFDTLKSVDEQKDICTVLLKLYAELNEQNKAITQLAKHIPFYLQDLEEWLHNEKYYSTLGYIYQFSEKYRKALVVWSQLINGDIVDKYGSNGLQESIDLLSTTNDPANLINNIQPLTTIALRQQQQQQMAKSPMFNIEPPKELVWEFAPLLMRKFPERSIKIFLTKRRDRLDNNEVIEFLQHYGLDMYQIYLEYLIFEEGNRNEQYHTKLALSYIDSVIKSSPEFFAPNQTRPANAEVLNDSRQKLVDLLEFSNCYNVPVLLSKIKTSLLYEELVILYLRIGNYELMFDIIVWKLNDFQKAEFICESFDPKHSLSSISYSTISSPVTGMSPATSSPTLSQRSSISLTSSSSSLNPVQSSSPRTQYRHSMILNNGVGGSPLLSSSAGSSSMMMNHFDLNQQQGQGQHSQQPPQLTTTISSPPSVTTIGGMEIKSSLYDPKRTELFLCLLKTYLSKSSKQLIDNFKSTPSTTTTSSTSSSNLANNNNVQLPNYLIEFLNKYYHEMDPIKVISLLPSNTLLSSLEYYLSMSFNHSISSQRETKIVKNLQKSQNLNTKIEHQTVCSSSIHMGLERTCPVCSKQIGDKVFAYFPNGVITHFKCFQSTHICPVTAKNFKKNPTNPIST